MASCADAKSQKNAEILMQKVFYQDLCRLSKAGFLFFRAEAHKRRHLEAVVEFTHFMTKMLEEYSRGRVLTIRTSRLRNARKKKKKARARVPKDELDEAEDELDELEEELDAEEEEELDLYGMELEEIGEEPEEPQFVERRFNFVSEISILVDYEVMSRFMLLLRQRAFLTSE